MVYYEECAYRLVHPFVLLIIESGAYRFLQPFVLSIIESGAYRFLQPFVLSIIESGAYRFLQPSILHRPYTLYEEQYTVSSYGWIYWMDRHIPLH